MLPALRHGFRSFVGCNDLFGTGNLFFGERKVFESSRVVVGVSMVGYARVSPAALTHARLLTCFRGGVVINQQKTYLHAVC